MFFNMSKKYLMTHSDDVLEKIQKIITQSNKQTILLNSLNNKRK